MSMARAPLYRMMCEGEKVLPILRIKFGDDSSVVMVMHDIMESLDVILKEDKKHEI